MLFITLVFAFVALSAAWRGAVPTRLRMVSGLMASTDTAKITEVDPSGVGVGGIEEGGFYSTRPRTEEDRNKKWVINMDTVERGWRDERDAAQRALKPPKTGPFTPDEDEQITRLVNDWPAGKRGMWAYVGRRVNRNEQHCMLRWTQHINAEYHKTKERSIDIIRDSEFNSKP